MAALGVGALGIGLAPFFVRWSIASGVGPTATAFWRIAFALPVLALGMWIEQRKQRPVPHKRPDPRLLILAGLLFAGDLAVWHVSIDLTTVANATLLANLSPLVVTLICWRLFGERFGKSFLFALAVALAGVVLLTGAGFEAGSKRLLGDALGVATAFFYASYVVTVKVLRTGYAPATLMFWSGLVMGGVLLVLTVLLREPMLPEAAKGMKGWLALLGLGLASHACGQGFIAYALAHLRAAFVALTLLLQPVFVAILGWFLFDEGFTPLQGAGALLILAGIVWARRKSDA
ncbi:MAG: DMT family transporter [Planctomycetota bacterium]